ncbi:hypothetical protein N7520_005041 [Penicillium odoratum]|uniref:uncharacterized protein n=1 Tax=Penicillium odoratum TaxID=1167516 RepID=UPI002547676F|nr:uncharacterized protein N7520_005041 [Penicillium odoratum]KAJ5765482.1 hypothetical protein N7520_005041 [Penicillium odoratum]
MEEMEDGSLKFELKGVMEEEGKKVRKVRQEVFIVVGGVTGGEVNEPQDHVLLQGSTYHAKGQDHTVIQDQPIARTH